MNAAGRMQLSMYTWQLENLTFKLIVTVDSVCKCLYDCRQALQRF